MCNCLSKFEEKVKKESQKEHAHLSDFKYLDGGFSRIYNYPKKALYSVFEYRYTFTKKDGNMSRPRTDSYNVNYSFCPFCGESLEEKETTPAPTFQEELISLLNKHSVENASNTPDFILGEYVKNCLEVFGKTISERDNWNKKS